MKHTLVLNQNFMPIAIIDSMRAFCNVYTDSVYVVHNYDDATFKSPNDEWSVPSIIRTKNPVKIPYVKSVLSKENVFKRDGYRCVYCGETTRKVLTIDHVHPRSRGGKNVWTNLAKSCYSCNNRKGDRTPDEMGWEKPPTFQPHYLVLMSNFSSNIPAEWKDYLMVGA